MIKSTSEVPTANRRRIGRLGWGIVLAMSLLLLLIPANYTPTGLSPQSWLLVMIVFLFLLLLGFLIGFILLLVRYVSFFMQARGTLLLLGLFILGLRVYAFMQTLQFSGWPFSQLLLLLPVWLMVLAFALPFALIIFLWYQDQSTRTLAYTLLITIWMLVFYTRRLGTEDLFTRTIQGNLPGELIGMLCFGQIVFFLASLFFIGHSVRLVFREWLQADMQLITDINS